MSRGANSDAATGRSRGPVIAIDGPAGAGKSTVARAVARRLSLRYLDTGAMYRAVALLAVEAGVAAPDQDAVVQIARTTSLRMTTDPNHPRVFVGDRDVTREVRSAEVTAAVSAVSAVVGVREHLVAQQRWIIDGGGIVVEGRDIGTVVAPDADLKIFLTASGEERARRRTSQEPAGPGLAGVEQALRRRDRFDSSRLASPLARAPDAVEIDSTGLDVHEVINRVLARVPGPRRPS